MAQRAIRGAECESVLQQVEALIKLLAHHGALYGHAAEGIGRAKASLSRNSISPAGTGRVATLFLRRRIP
jgi:hypothetical protein